jgi:hypothetical protein
MEFCLKYGLLLVLIIGITNAIHAEQEEEASSNWRPVVLMHGLLASAEAMSHAQKWIEADYPVSCRINFLTVISDCQHEFKFRESTSRT